jgi:hypothetical protein
MDQDRSVVESAEREKSIAFARQKVARGKEFASRPGKERLALSEFKQGLQFAVCVSIDLLHPLICAQPVIKL